MRFQPLSTVNGWFDLRFQLLSIAIVPPDARFHHQTFICHVVNAHQDHTN